MARICFGLYGGVRLLQAVVFGKLRSQIFKLALHRLPLRLANARMDVVALAPRRLMAERRFDHI